MDSQNIKGNMKDTGVFEVTEGVEEIFKASPKVVIPESRGHLLDLATGWGQSVFKVNYEVEGQGVIEEATVTKCKNGVSVNFVDVYMRRRDPDCMVIGDEKLTDKTKYKDKYDKDFGDIRQATYEWLKKQELIVMPFLAGDEEYGYPALLICPLNAGFFAGGLADLQGFIPRENVKKPFKPKAIIFVAPTFRHSHFEGRQVVAHNRTEEVHEIFAYNLYPGPSAKKGIYGVLLNIGESENWTTVHASCITLTTPYDNTLTIMHEGASGGGKSEMLEEIHRQPDGTILFAQNIINNERIKLEMADTCEISPVTDDMAMCHPELQNNKKLVVKDAEAGWFLRFNHITSYGTSPQHEKLCIHPPEPLIFLNMDAAPDSTILIWEHIEDAPGQPCPNPRVIMPRHFVPGTSTEPAEIDVRSFGVRTPPSTKDNPTYGIIGCLHILPPALAWIWRLVAPRGHANPSITDSEGMLSEGVGSYWPFATGKMVDHANLLLDQIVNTPRTRYVLIPNQYIGSYKVGFNAQWIAREYLARKGGADFKEDRIVESRCPLLGYSLKKLRINGQEIPEGMLRTELQLGMGEKAYDEGAGILNAFFNKELQKFYTTELHPLGRKIIECFMKNGTVDEYLDLIPMED